MIIIHAVLPIRPEARDEFLGASLAEPGVLEYGLHESVATPNTFTMVERFTDQAALQSHLGSEHFTAAGGALAGWVSGPPKLTQYVADDGTDLPLG